MIWGYVSRTLNCRVWFYTRKGIQTPFLELTAGRNSKTCPDVYVPSPIAILATVTGGFSISK